MKLKPIKANMTELEIGEITILFSYETPVACHINGVRFRGRVVDRNGYCRTEKKWSATTTRHINQWLRDNNAENVTERPQEYFDNLAGGPND